VYTAAQADRGQAAYVKSCGGCHRDDMSGGDDSEPPLRGAHFTDKWEGASVAEIYDFVANNMPKNSPGSLPLETCIDIVAFMLESNDMPVGRAELTTDIDTLAEIVFTAKRP
jgi:cytochrome c